MLDVRCSFRLGMRSTWLKAKFTNPEAVAICWKRSMPTIPGIPGPYRIFFYSFDCNEPKHVHVRRERFV